MSRIHYIILLCYCQYVQTNVKGGAMGYYQRIRDLREDCDLTQRQIAELLHLTQSQYQLYESGRRDIPTELLIELAKFHKVSTDFILGLTNDPTPSRK